jgi:hypothetical protein
MSRESRRELGEFEFRAAGSVIAATGQKGKGVSPLWWA